MGRLVIKIMQTKVRLEAISMAELLKLDSVGFIDTAGIDPQAGSTLLPPRMKTLYYAGYKSTSAAKCDLGRVIVYKERKRFVRKGLDYS